MMETFVQLISNVGFPIACCVAMFMLMKKQGEQHKEEMEHLKDALDNNTAALAELSKKIK